MQIGKFVTVFVAMTAAICDRSIAAPIRYVLAGPAIEASDGLAGATMRFEFTYEPSAPRSTPYDPDDPFGMDIWWIYDIPQGTGIRASFAGVEFFPPDLDWGGNYVLYEDAPLYLYRDWGGGHNDTLEVYQWHPRAAGTVLLALEFIDTDGNTLQHRLPPVLPLEEYELIVGLIQTEDHFSLGLLSVEEVQLVPEPATIGSALAALLVFLRWRVSGQGPLRRPPSGDRTD